MQGVTGEAVTKLLPRRCCKLAHLQLGPPLSGSAPTEQVRDLLSPDSTKAAVVGRQEAPPLTTLICHEVIFRALERAIVLGQRH